MDKMKDDERLLRYLRYLLYRQIVLHKLCGEGECDRKGVQRLPGLVGMEERFDNHESRREFDVGMRLLFERAG